MTHKVKANLTPTLFSVKHTSPLNVKVTGPATTMQMPATNEEGMRAVDCIPVTNLDTGEEGVLLLPTVVKRVFDTYGPEIVGACFCLTDGGIADGKNYRRVIVQELEAE